MSTSPTFTSSPTDPAGWPQQARTASTQGPLWLFRFFATLHALLMAAQPMSIGRFLEGEFGMLKVHSAMGGIGVLTAWLLIPAAVLLWRPARLGAGPLAWSLAMSFAVPAQVALGHTRSVGIHIPLGVSIVAVAVGLAVWACWPGRALRSARTRPAPDLAAVPR